VRRWVSAVAVVVFLVYAGPVLADTPALVYSDFAEDGVLSCGHSRSALKRVLNDASLYQYGDPLTFQRLKLAVRKQLAGSCRRPNRTALAEGSPVAESEPDARTSTRSSKTTTKSRQGPGQQPSPLTSDNAAVAGKTDASERSGGMVLLGVVLLLLALGSGGWAARRAFTSRQ
jgi:cobalamin biosynthesis Mg chelatase CobN